MVVAVDRAFANRVFAGRLRGRYRPQREPAHSSTSGNRSAGPRGGGPITRAAAAHGGTRASDGCTGGGADSGAAHGGTDGGTIANTLSDFHRPTHTTSAGYIYNSAPAAARGGTCRTYSNFASMQHCLSKPYM